MSKKEHKAEQTSQVEVHNIPTRIITRRNSILFGSLLVLLLLSVGWLTFIAISGNKSNDTNKNSQAKKADVVAIATKEAEIQKVIIASDNTNKDKNISSLTSQAKSAQDSTVKATYLRGAATVAANTGDYKKAIELARQADALVPSALNSALIGFAAREMGDLKLAAEAFGQAADRSEKTDDPTLASPYNDYKNLQKAVQAQ
jgi:tetratricopeptide (TPR) repeat protein